MGEKPTVMVLKVDLQCPCCYKKVKKILCKFPQIRNQVYDEKANTVTITVVCCNPEKLRDKLCCKGCKVIKSIVIKEPEKPPPPPPQKKPPPPPPQEKPPPPPPPQEKPPPPPPPQEKPPPPPPQEKPPPPPPNMGPGPCQVYVYPPSCPVPRRTCCRECSEGYGGGPCYHGHGVPPQPPPQNPEVRTCCRECYEGYGGGPCYRGHGVPPPPPPCYDGYGYGYGPSRGCNVSKCGYYFSEENPHSCSIM